MDKNIILKTSLFGFEKKGTIDYIEKLQLENEGLKRQVQDLSSQQNALLKENAMFRARVDLLSNEKAQAAQSSFTAMTFEDLSVAPEYAMPYEKVGKAKPTVSKKGGKTYISSKK